MMERQRNCTTVNKAAIFLAGALAVCLAAKAATDFMDTVRSGGSAVPAGARATLNIVDWNIDRGARLEGITAGLKSQEPDIAILQEVDLNARRSDRLDVARELGARLNLNYVFGPEFQELGQGSGEMPAYHGQAILTSLPLRSTRIIRFARQSGFWKPRPMLPSWALFQRRLGGRIALVAELDFKGTKLVVYNLHLESRSGGAIQYDQVKEVLADAGQYPKDTPIIIAGDLNTKYPPSIRNCLKLLNDNGFESAFGQRHLRTHVLIGDLDWIFTRGAIALSGAQVLHDAHGSDHYPISAKLRFTGTSSGRFLSQTASAKASR